ncbi:MAG: hypothetical protein KAI47_24105, partial [Deltaproteobacteria bacterium]|nr:hypothetical protein [Deltaproteobacteria bacterium]
PEQALGETIAPQTDLYAVGVILYELLAGRPPFSGTNTLRLLHDHAHTPIKPLTEAFPDLALPEAVSDVVATCLQKDPKDRPASAQALVDDLHTTTRAVAIHQEAEERALLELVGITRRSSRGLFWGLGAVILLALVLVGVFLLGRSHGDDDGKALAPGDRLFVSAAGPTPSWAQADAPESQAALKVLKAGVAQVRGLKTRREALALAEVLAVTKRLDILLRFDAERETPSFLDDLRRISEDYQHAKTPLEVIGRYWVKLVEAQGNHKLATRYDAYVKVSPPASPEQRKALLRVLADRRFQNTSFLLDRAVNKRHCDRARALGARLRAAIDDLKVSKARKASMRGYLDTQQLARCK